MNEYIDHGENGLLVDAYEDPQSVAGSIYTAATNFTLRNHLKSTARKTVARFDKYRVAAREAMLYRSIISRRGEIRDSRE